MPLHTLAQWKAFGPAEARGEIQLQLEVVQHSLLAGEVQQETPESAWCCMLHINGSRSRSRRLVSSIGLVRSTEPTMAARTRLQRGLAENGHINLNHAHRQWQLEPCCPWTACEGLLHVARPMQPLDRVVPD